MGKEILKIMLVCGRKYENLIVWFFLKVVDVYVENCIVFNEMVMF